MEHSTTIPVHSRDEQINLGPFGYEESHYIRNLTSAIMPASDGRYAYTLETSSVTAGKNGHRQIISVTSDVLLTRGHRIDLLFEQLSPMTPAALVGVRYTPVLQTIRASAMDWSFWKLGDTLARS